MDNSPQTVAERPLSVTYRPLGSLVPRPHNARTHPPRQVQQMVASIREFGFTNPILIDPGHNPRPVQTDRKDGTGAMAGAAGAGPAR